MIICANGLGGISISLEGPKKTPVNIQDNRNKTITVSFTPELAGTYMVNVSSAGKPVPGSPFVCHVMSTAG